MLIRIISGIATWRALRRRVDQLTKTVDLAERLMMEAMVRIKRILISGDEVIEVTGTDDEIRLAVARLSQRTKMCVKVTVVVGQYHRRGCLDRKSGGYMPEGN